MWRRRLREVLHDNAEFAARTTARDEALIRELVAQLGTDIIETFRAVDAGYVDIAWLRRSKGAAPDVQVRSPGNSWDIVN